ncbi:Serine-rich coiled-coil domain containing protein 2, partial [Dissostichus eleginoides]
RSHLPEHHYQYFLFPVTSYASFCLPVFAPQGLMQSLCKQVINGSEHCSYGWRAEAGGAGLEEKKNLSSGETFTLWRRKQRQPQLGDTGTLCREEEGEEWEQGGSQGASPSPKRGPCCYLISP